MGRVEDTVEERLGRAVDLEGARHHERVGIVVCDDFVDLLFRARHAFLDPLAVERVAHPTRIRILAVVLHRIAVTQCGRLHMYVVHEVVRGHAKHDKRHALHFPDGEHHVLRPAAPTPG